MNEPIGKASFEQVVVPPNINPYGSNMPEGNRKLWQYGSMYNCWEVLQEMRKDEQRKKCNLLQSGSAAQAKLAGVSSLCAYSPPAGLRPCE